MAMIYTYREKALLRKLSEDASSSIDALAKAAKCSRSTAYKVLSMLENKLKIRYTLELDEAKMGISERHLIIVKFKEKPEQSYLSKLFENDINISNAYMCDGDFDLILNVRSNDPMQYIVWESRFPGTLADYEPKVYPSELMINNFGYFPMNPEQVYLSNLNEKDKLIIAELLRNSRASVTELSKKLGIKRTTLEYRIHMLKKEGVIKRFTIAVNKPDKEYILAYIVNYIFTRDTPARSVRMMNYYKEYDEELPLLNTFQLLAPMSGSYRFLGVGLFNDEEDAIKGAIKSHISIFEKEHVNIKYARIVGLLKGSYPFRNMDIHSNYNRFNWNNIQNDKLFQTK